MNDDNKDNDLPVLHERDLTNNELANNNTKDTILHETTQNHTTPNNISNHTTNININSHNQTKNFSPSITFYNTLCQQAITYLNFPLVHAISNSEIYKYIHNDTGFANIMKTLDIMYYRKQFQDIEANVRTRLPTRILDDATNIITTLTHKQECELGIGSSDSDDNILSYKTVNSTTNSMTITTEIPNPLHIAEKNTWINNNVNFVEFGGYINNYIRLPQYESAKTIFSLEQGSWDATYHRLAREPLEAYKMRIMYMGDGLLHSNLNFMRETIGRILDQKHIRNTIFKPTNSGVFTPNKKLEVPYEVQKEKFMLENPTGIAPRTLHSEDLLIGKFDDPIELEAYIKDLSKRTVKFYGYNDPAIYTLSGQENYVARCVDVSEFYYEFRCCILYTLYNRNITNINFICPRMTMNAISDIITDSVKVRLNTTLSHLDFRIYQLYQIFNNNPNYSILRDKLSYAYNDDIMSVLKLTAIRKYKISINNNNYLYPFDFRFGKLDLDKLPDLDNIPSSLYDLCYVESSYIIRMLDVMGLIKKNNVQYRQIDRNYGNTRNYMREFVKHLTINSDYIVQKTIGSLQNLCYVDPEVAEHLQMVVNLSIQQYICGNINVDALGNITDVWTNNSVVWNDRLIIYPNIDRQDNLIQEVRITVNRRLDWHRLPNYYNIPTWNFGNIHNVIKSVELRDNIDYVFKHDSKHNYTDVRNTMIRLSYDRQTPIIKGYKVSSGGLILQFGLYFDRAIRTEYKSKISHNYKTFCEIPTPLLFCLCNHWTYSIRNHVWNDLYHNIKWTNVVSEQDLFYCNSYNLEGCISATHQTLLLNYK